MMAQRTRWSILYRHLDVAFRNCAVRRPGEPRGSIRWWRFDMNSDFAN